MKKFFFIGALLVLSVSLHAQIKSAKLQASGLTCAMCAKSIYKNLVSLPFIENVDTDLEGSAFILTFKNEASINIDALRKKVEDAGFAVAGLEITAHVEKISVLKDAHLTLDGNVVHVIQSKDPELSGDVKFKIIDRSFLGPKEQKKYAKMSDMQCFQTGFSASCCKAMGIQENTRIYHVII